MEVDPGEGKPLEDGDRIQVSNSLPDVDPDEFLAALDGDTREYLRLLIAGAGKGLEGRSTDLRETLRRLGPTHRDLARVSEAVADRRANMRRLINRYGLLTTELGRSDHDVTRLVRASNAALGAFADEDENLSGTVARLPGTLRQTEQTLGKVETLANRMGPTFESLRPAFSKLDEANAAVRPFVEGGRTGPEERGATVRAQRATVPARSRRRVEGARRRRAGHDQGVPRPQPAVRHRRLQPRRERGHLRGLREAGRLHPAAERARNEGFLYWLAWVGNNTTSLFSTADALGPIRRAYLLNLNCNILLSAARIRRTCPPEEIQPLVDLLGGTGACAKP